MKICAVLVVTIALSNIAAQENSKQKFTSNLIGKTFSQNPTGNLVISPFSVLANLGLAYQGASGSTYEAFTNTLTMPSSAALAELFQKIFTSLNGLENATLETANKIYVAEKFKIDPAFAGIARSSFQAEAQSVDFSGAEAEINQWVAEKTHGKITQLVSQSDFDGMTALVLLNAIYFKGDWLFKFDQTKTTKEPFFLNNSEARKVDMMHLTADLGYGEDSSLDAKILELPYKNERLSMVILLPNKKDGIDELQRKLSNFHINALLQNMDELRVQVALPKFKIETTFDLKYPLRAVSKRFIFAISFTSEIFLCAAGFRRNIYKQRQLFWNATE